MWNVGLYTVLFHMVLVLPASAQAAKEITLERVNNGREIVVPEWQHGSFVSFAVPDGGPTQHVYVHDRNGSLIVNSAVSIPEATRVDIADAALSPDGEIAVSGGAQSRDGRVSPFIA
jgi:hypothetical protein